MLELIGMVFCSAILVMTGRVDLAQYIMQLCIMWVLVKKL